jgi:hypothetical protein
MKVAVRAHQTATSWQVRMSETRLSCPMRPASAHPPLNDMDAARVRLLLREWPGADAPPSRRSPQDPGCRIRPASHARHPARAGGNHDDVTSSWS